MAAKKQKKNNGINLLKGITGSKLAKLIAVLFILAAIPLTVLMSQKQQNTRQEASTSYGTCNYNNTRGTCYNNNTTLCTGGYWKTRLCKGAANIQCCFKDWPPKVASTTPHPEKCASDGYFKIGLNSKATDDKNTVDVLYRIRPGTDCSRKIDSGWIHSGINNDYPYSTRLKCRDFYGNAINYQFSAIPRTGNWQYGNTTGLSFCGAYWPNQATLETYLGWYPAKSFRYAP
ncbi:MAG: hypothetical protein COY68_04230 [Candidatus Levybacteria bacterium CG_4_10_14_0_8_um_filter_35_23]|nr:MAG: hypothetical protein COY68_04230 [Candidatus Levybacteria bacterium CG_4_10_14_0_8_um_filter_35_23]